MFPLRYFWPVKFVIIHSFIRQSYGALVMVPSSIPSTTEMVIGKKKRQYLHI